jgi:hypothetical protein
MPELDERGVHGRGDVRQRVDGVPSMSNNTARMRV